MRVIRLKMKHFIINEDVKGRAKALEGCTESYKMGPRKPSKRGGERKKIKRRRGKKGMRKEERETGERRERKMRLGEEGKEAKERTKKMRLGGDTERSERETRKV